MPRSAASPFPGLSRREFLSYCGKLAGLLALSSAAVPEIAAALGRLAERPSVVWSCFAECRGCSISLLQNSAPGPASLILNTISFGYSEALMAAAGSSAEAVFHDAVAQGGFIYIVEGAIPTDPPEAVLVAKRPGLDVVRETAAKADMVIAIGNCAAFGGVQAASPNPTRAKGVPEVLPPNLAEKVITIPTCPGSGDALVAVLSYISFNGRAPELDQLGRPLFLYGETVHDNCERRAHFESGEFVESFGRQAEAKGDCLYLVGCKGPHTYAPCPKLRFNDSQNWCVGVGPCVGCAEPRFWDRFAPYSEPMPGVTRPGIGGVTAESFAGLAAGTSAVVMGAHFIGQAATDRLPWSGDGPDGGQIGGPPDSSSNAAAQGSRTGAYRPPPHEDGGT